ncbi:hypothetical protein AGLY_013587 [Aphis glycines]|uniref:Uncharacterized protein n=1 Tax=Aphis glycines TaxID=307491 RepID=A0A6G0T8U6_APHGL|nr:hypothetical protein AGLY_013587 [Aphis glycines]
MVLTENKKKKSIIYLLKWKIFWVSNSVRIYCRRSKINGRVFLVHVATCTIINIIISGGEGLLTEESFSRWCHSIIIITIIGRKPRPTTKLAVQLTPTAILVANGRADELNNSATKNQGMDPGPTANAMTKAITKMVSITVMTNMDENPIINRVLRPVSSTKNREISVIITLSVPMPRVAYLAPSSVIPAILKIFVEKNMTWKNKKSYGYKLTALIPDNCWHNIIITDMPSGVFNIGFDNISRRVTRGITFIASFSALISSISSCTSIVPLSH